MRRASQGAAVSASAWDPELQTLSDRIIANRMRAELQDVAQRACARDLYRRP